MTSEKLSEKKQAKAAAKALRRVQAKHKRAAKKAEAALHKFEKRSRQALALEVKIVQLEQHLYEHRHSDLQPANGNKDLRPVRLIFNPESGESGHRVETLESIVTALRRHGLRAEVGLKMPGKTGRQWAREAAAKKEALVIVAGGDGTLEEAAVQLIGSQTALGIIPIGSRNNLAHALGIPSDIDQACALLAAGITRQIDVGRIRLQKGSGKNACKYFMETAGLGLAIAFPAGQNIQKGHWGKLPVEFGKLVEQGPTPIEIQLDTGETIQTHLQLVTVSNAPLFALNNLIAPEAKLDDGLLDVAVYDGMGELELADYLIKTANGTRVDHPKVRFYQAQKVLVRAGQKMSATADKAELPDGQAWEFETLTGALTAVVGKSPALLWPVEALASARPLEPSPNGRGASQSPTVENKEPQATDAEGQLAWAGSEKGKQV